MRMAARLDAVASRVQSAMMMKDVSEYILNPLPLLQGLLKMAMYSLLQWHSQCFHAVLVCFDSISVCISICSFILILLDIEDNGYSCERTGQGHGFNGPGKGTYDSVTCTCHFNLLIVLITIFYFFILDIIHNG